jgi:hypothetical protein
MGKTSWATGTVMLNENLHPTKVDDTRGQIGPGTLT